MITGTTCIPDVELQSACGEADLLWLLSPPRSPPAAFSAALLPAYRAVLWGRPRYLLLVSCPEETPLSGRNVDKRFYQAGTEPLKVLCVA